MAIAITQNIRSVTASAPNTPTSGIVLQAGQVITAQVVQVLGNDQVQIAIGNQTIAAATQVPLQVGQTLQLQVSQTPEGIGLAIVNQPSSATTDQATTGQTSSSASASSNPVITLSPSLAATLAANLTPDAVTPASALTQLETLAVSAAAQTAATQQTSLAPLFADLNVANSLPNLPPQVQQAVAQVLAQQTNLDQNLTAAAVKQAFQSSGIFLETSLASGSAPLSNGVPDLKAALVVLRQTLTSALSDTAAVMGTATPTSPSAPTAVATPQAAPSQQTVAPPVEGGAEGTTPSTATPSEPTATGSAPVPTSPNVAQPAAALGAAILAETTELVAQAGALPVAVAAEAAPQEILSALLVAPPAATVTPAASAASSTQAIAQQILGLVGNQNLTGAAASADAARAVASSAVLNLLQEVVAASPLAAINPSQFVFENSQALALLPVAVGVRMPDDAEFARSNLPPPPINGALPSAQAVAPATLSARTPLQTMLQHLLDDTDGALARQTLLQIASLPGQAADPSATRIDPSIPRWNFEIPFATPQGTAMAQFEISRDGGGRDASTTKATWRARFSLNVEPAGPVHALVSLIGERTSVRMWAERPATASQLRAGVSQLTQALSRAELTPGDIVIRDGAPQQPAAAPAGHFLDRAT